jgi:hypothetical protein
MSSKEALERNMDEINKNQTKKNKEKRKTVWPSDVSKERIMYVYYTNRLLDRQYGFKRIRFCHLDKVAMLPPSAAADLLAGDALEK